VARSLDRLGDRWTLLLVRELLLGPKRFKDLEAGLPGIASNLLSGRLKQLERDGIIRHTRLPSPADVPVYELTEAGRELEPVILSLARWGMRHLPPARPEDLKRPEWMLLSLRARFRPDQATGVRETYEFRIDDEIYHARVEDDRVTTRRGTAADPDLVLITDADTLFELASETLELETAMAEGRLKLEGDPEAFERMGRIFGGARQTPEASEGTQANGSASARE
jgi:DNA-binding HxlR family transcriptional regulator/putative sterol carrier protein